MPTTYFRDAPPARLDLPHNPRRAGSLVPALRLLSDIGLTGSNRVTFAGSVARPDDSDGDVSDYVAGEFRVVHELCRFAVGSRDAADDADMQLDWDGDELTVEVSLAGTLRATYSLRPLNEHQVRLAGILRRGNVPDAEPLVQVLDLDDAAVRVAAAVGHSRPMPSLEDTEPDDPTGMLEFVDVLTRAAVSTWDPDALDLLTGLAKNWCASAEELLATARTIGFAPVLAGR